MMSKSFTYKSLYLLHKPTSCSIYSNKKLKERKKKKERRMGQHSAPFDFCIGGLMKVLCAVLSVIC